MEIIIDKLIKAFFDKHTLESLWLFFAGILVCLLYLQNKFQFFERLDKITDALNDVVEMLKYFDKLRTKYEIRRKLEKGKDLDSGDL